MLDSRVWTHTCRHSMKGTQHRQFSSLGWHLNSVHSLRSGVFYLGLCRLFACFVCFVSVKLARLFCCFMWAHLTYSADFQKCPGWERRRFRLGNFSSKSISLEKLGRSSGLYAQHRSRISCKMREQRSQTYFRNWKLALKYLRLIISRYHLEIRLEAKLKNEKQT